MQLNDKAMLEKGLYFHHALPGDIPLQSLCFDHERHEFELEWYGGPGKVLSVTLTNEGKWIYVALIGKDSPHGYFEFNGKVPDFIIALIRRVL